MSRLSIPSDVDVDIKGGLTVRGTISPAIARSNLQEDSDQAYSLSLTSAKVWDAAQTNLPGTAAADDLEITTGTWGTSVPSIQTGDLKAAGATSRYALLEFALPPEYVATGTVTFRASAGMITTIADTACTIDITAYKSDREAAVDGADLCTTSAQSMNSLTFADLDFSLTSAALSAGDKILIRIEIACNDSASGTAVIGVIGDAQILLDIKG